MNNDEKKIASNEGALTENDCFTDRKTVSKLDSTEGEIFLMDNVNFGIRHQGDHKPLLPCNLPAVLQKAGTKIIFSGAIKETRLEELLAGEPFVLTRAEEI